MKELLAGIEVIWVEVMAFWLLRLFLISFQNSADQSAITQELSPEDLTGVNIVEPDSTR